MFEKLKQNIRIVEVGPRDGLQHEKICLSLEDKLEYIRLLSQSGLKTIEATSFVRADKIPQMADAIDLYLAVKQIDNFNEIDFPCLIPNVRGYELAKKAGVTEISLFSATSDAFTQSNINCSVAESFKRMEEVSAYAKQDGVKIRGYISTAFGCPFGGKTSVKKLIDVAQKFLDLGAYEVSIGDTTGVAVPSQVDAYLKDFLKEIPIKKVAMHFHDTKKLALTNILVSLEHGIEVLDSASGGLGGCPYAGGMATGNVATEDVWYLLDSLGVKTGIDINKLIIASEFILSKVGRKSSFDYLKS